MADEQKRCPLCGEEAQYGQSGHSEIYRYEGCACGAYYAHDTELPMAGNEIKAGGYGHLPALLYERKLKGLHAPLLVFIQSNLPSARKNIDFAEPIFVGDLLAQWPETVPGRIDRCLCNLAKHTDTPGEKITVKGKDTRMITLFFSDNAIEADYYVTAMMKYGWLENLDSVHPTWNFMITPEGWKRVGELAGGAERQSNPAFVAM